ncbi:hypothetical protein [Rufibacter immobilis]|uniref:hypothetical protein n=1 Tax=Rufibacter immobilis TaxID=1348778 RepID=UPI0035E77623
MQKMTRMLFGLMIGGMALGSCERVKDKEAVADLPDTSVEDTLVLTPDTLELDTVLTDAQLAAYGSDENDGDYAQPLDGSEASGTAGTSAGAESQAQEVDNSPIAAAPAPAKKVAPAKKKYVRPTQRQLQSALAQDARRSTRMDLPQLKNYWLKRQHYYRRATKEVKFVSGDTKIKISPEETKIETARGKVKIEGNDIKVKYD